MVHMAERCPDDTGGDHDDAEQWEVGPLKAARRVVQLRPASRPQPAAPAWAGGVTGGWSPEGPAPTSASALAESVFPFAAELPFEPDPEAAAFLNAPRRPLAFYVAPFGTPPFGNAPSGERSVFGGPAEAGAAGISRRGVVEQPAWGPAYPAGA
jgi:hypothetical protein